MVFAPLGSTPLTLLPLLKGEVFGWLPFLTVDLVAGSKKSSGLLAGSWACTKPFNSELRGAFWQKTELRRAGGFTVKSGGVFFSHWRNCLAN